MGRLLPRSVRALGLGRWFLPVNLFLATVVATGPVSATTYDWTGLAASSNWSAYISGPFGTVIATNWNGTVFPVSAATTGLNFQTSYPPVVVQNDIADPFVLNRLVIDFQYILTGGALQFVSNGATTPTMQISGAQQILMPLILSDPTAIIGSGPVTLKAISGAGSLDDGVVTTLSGGSVALGGAQSYTRDVTLSANTTLSSSNGGNISLGSSVNGGGFALTINTGGATSLGVVGPTTPLASFSTDAAGTTTLYSIVRTNGSQSYGDAVTLGGVATLTSLNNGNIVFAKTIDGLPNLTINTSGQTILGGAVGATTPLSSLTTDAGGSTRLGGGSVSTDGFQTYNDPVQLTAATTLTSNFAGINFNGTLNGQFPLTVHTAGTATFAAAVGGSTPLTSLTFAVNNANGGAVIAGSIQQTSGQGTTTFTGLLHATGGGGIALTGNAFSLASLQSDVGPISISNTAAGTVSGPIGGPVALTKTGAGTLNLAGANTYIGPTNVNGGTLKVTGSIAASAMVQVNANATFDAAATQTVQGLQIVGLGKTVVSGNVLKVVSDTVPFSIAIGILSGTDSGALDLTTHGLIIDVPPGQESSMRDTVRFYTLVGFGGGNWQGPGIRSSAAAANPSTGVGYAVASDVLGPSGGTFMGMSVDGSAVLARYTLLGDTDLDGAVGFPDLVRLAQNYNGTNKFWLDGDFNYDGNVDFADLAKLAQNYNGALPGEPISGAPAAFDGDLARAFASVPEPTCAICFLLAGSIALARPRRA